MGRKKIQILPSTFNIAVAVAFLVLSNRETDKHVYVPKSANLTSFIFNTLSTITVPSRKYGFLLVISSGETLTVSFSHDSFANVPFVLHLIVNILPSKTLLFI